MAEKTHHKIPHKEIVVKGDPALRITTKQHVIGKLLDRLWEIGIDPNIWCKENIKPWMWEDEIWLDSIINTLAELTNTYVRIVFE
jgi:hypothetical protein